MSFTEINSLRKSGKLQDAYHLADQGLEAAEKNNSPQELLWAKRAMSWVLYDYLKRSVENADIEKVHRVLEQINELALAEDETMFYDSVAWQYGKVLFLLANLPPLKKTEGGFLHIKDVLNQHTQQTKTAELVIELIFSSNFTKPSAQYSYVLSGINKLHKQNVWNSKFLEIIDKWDLNNLRDEDFVKVTLANGKTMPSLAEQAFNGYAKAFIDVLEKEYAFNEGAFNDDALNDAKLTIEKLESFFGKINFKFKRLYYSKMYAAAGAKDMALEQFLPFAKLNTNLYWVWESLGDFLIGKPEEQIKCYSKAIVLANAPKYCLNIYEKLSKLFLANHSYAEAKACLIKFIEIREQNGWAIKGFAKESINAPWFNDAEKGLDLKTSLENFSIGAESILLSDLPEELVVVTNINYAKGFFSFIFFTDKKETGYSKFSKSIKLEVGDTLSVKLQKPVDGKAPHKLFQLQKTTKTPHNEILRLESGSIRINEGQNFGFLRGHDKSNAFIDPSLIQKEGLQNGQVISSVVIADYDSKKARWGWKVVKVIR